MTVLNGERKLFVFSFAAVSFYVKDKERSTIKQDCSWVRYFHGRIYSWNLSPIYIGIHTTTVDVNIKFILFKSNSVVGMTIRLIKKYKKNKMYT